MAKQIYSFVKDDKGIYRPWVPVKIYNPADKTKFLNMHALLDTGADECVFPQIAADKSGFDLKAAGIETKEMQGVGAGKIQVWYHSFAIELLTPDLKNVFWRCQNNESGLCRS